MAKVGAQRAADITGVSKSTIQRAMKSGKLSYSMDSNGYRVIDTSELERVYGLNVDIDEAGKPAPQATTAQASVEQELAKANTMIEMERMKMKIYMLEQQLDAANGQIEDLKDQRDQWQKQASQVLITSEYSQKQAEELKEQIRQRDERVRAAKARREKMRAEKMQNGQRKQAVKAASEQANQQVADQNVQTGPADSFVDNTRSYTDLTQDMREAEAMKNKAVCLVCLGAIRKLTRLSLSIFLKVHFAHRKADDQAVHFVCDFDLAS